MRALPRPAQIYIILIILIGLLTAGATVVRPAPWPEAGWEVALFLGLAVLAAGRKIALMRHRGDEDVCSMSLSFVITFAALLRFGPATAVLVSAAGTLAATLFPKRQPLHQLLFNIALTIAETWAGGQAYLALGGHIPAWRAAGTLAAVAGSCLTFYAGNTAGVALVIALCTGRPVVRLWRQTFLWTAPSYFAGAFISTLALLVFGRHIGINLLLLSPVAYLVYQSYAISIARTEEKQQHIEALERSQEHLAELYLATIKSLALAIDAKDQFTHQHILRVQRYAVATARAMGVDGKELEGLATGALLHDIGKLGVPEYVLLKPGRLTDEEFAKIKKHPEIGAAILDPVDFPWPVLPVVKSHHEKWDGTGYPDGLQGEEIPRTARILAVADVYDALTSNRSYRNAWSHERAIETIKRGAGTHFDPAVVEAFLRVVDGVAAEMRAEQEPASRPQPVAHRPAPSKAEEAARDIQRASSELWALYEVAQTLSSSIGLQETLDILARKIEAIMPGASCLFLLKMDPDEPLRVRAVVGPNQAFFEGCRVVSEGSRSCQVMQARETYLGRYDADDLLLNGVSTAAWTVLETALIVPIVHQGQVLGTINLYHPQPDAFSPHDQQLLETIAERAAMALYNGMLFDRTRSHAITDSLTELYNLRYLTQQMEERCRRAEPAAEADEPFSLLCLDLDSFKPINDNFGHQKGDEVLRDLARIFRAVVGEDGIVARYGGDEFLIILDHAGPYEAEAMTARLQLAVAAYDPGLVHYKLGPLHLGVSIGYGCFPADGRDGAALISAADLHMYREKMERKLGRLADSHAGQEYPSLSSERRAA